MSLLGVPTDGPRIPLLTLEEMSDEQRHLYDQVVSGPRGQMIGPLRAAIHSPELARRWSALGEFLRFQTCIEPRFTELAVLVTGRRWTSQVEWWVHAKVSEEAGIPVAVIEAIRDLRPPVFHETADFEVYEFARLLQHDGQVSLETHQAIERRWGTRGVVELTAVVGYYTMVAMTLNAHRIPVPEAPAPLPDAPSLVVLAPAKLASRG